MLRFQALTAIALATFVPWLSSYAEGNARSFPTATPIKYLVVIFQENRSFDHYFATYPKAANDAPDEPVFAPKRKKLKKTPSVNGLTSGLIANNPNSVKPFRLGRDEAATCDPSHDYMAVQKAANLGLLNAFPETTGQTSPTCSDDPGIVMGYYDGNTVTAWWNYAQHFALNQNFRTTTYGSSTPGSLMLIAGTTVGAEPRNLLGDLPEIVEGTVIGDPDPLFDDCSTSSTAKMTGKNVGDLLNEKGVTWGWYYGGFKPTSRNSDGTANCDASHTGSNGAPQDDYIPHQQPFQYYESTSNPHHLPPTSPDTVGFTDHANHQYDLTDFWDAVAVGNVPAVTFLKASGYQDGHPGYSSPLAEQTFLVETLNRLQRLPQWKHMAVMISYVTPGGWYDHAMAPIISASSTAYDAVSGAGMCGTPTGSELPGTCGYGMRMPFLLISRFARVNFVDSTLTDISSVTRFIRENWGLGNLEPDSFDQKAGSLMNMFHTQWRPRAGRLLLNPSTGAKK